MLTAPSPRLKPFDTRKLKSMPKRADRFYVSIPWRTLMASIIAERGRRCQDPAHQGTHDPGARIFGDHIVELADGGALLDKRNVMLVCGSCHNKKTAQARASRR